MTGSSEAGSPDDQVADTAKSAGSRWRLIAAIGLAIVAAVILAGELTLIATDHGSASTGAVSDAGNAPAPVPLDAQPFSFLDHPAIVPDLKFVDGDERPVSLSEFKGRPVLLNIWATWCLPCRREMGSLDRLQAKFDPAKLRVLALSIDRGGAPVVKKFYSDLGLKSLGVYVDQSGAALHGLGLIGVPGTLLIDAMGHEVGRKLGPAEWDSPEMVALFRDHFGVESSQGAAGTRP
jgi:thiol-disulfide isomerase/thioredoxin